MSYAIQEATYDDATISGHSVDLNKIVAVKMLKKSHLLEILLQFVGAELIPLQAAYQNIVILTS